jgi:hypothetical protein
VTRSTIILHGSTSQKTILNLLPCLVLKLDMTVLEIHNFIVFVTIHNTSIRTICTAVYLKAKECLSFLKLIYKMNIFIITGVSYLFFIIIISECISKQFRPLNSYTYIIYFFKYISLFQLISFRIDKACQFHLLVCYNFVSSITCIATFSLLDRV